MIQTAIGRRYAKALFELLTPADIGPAKAALRMLEQKASVIEKLAARAGCPTMGQRFLAHVVSKNRIAQIREISEAFSDLADRSSNRTAVEVSSARPLSEEDCRAISMRLEQITKRSVDLTARVDPALIGGLEIRIHSTVYDGTVRGQLERMRAALMKI